MFQDKPVRMCAQYFLLSSKIKGNAAWGSEGRSENAPFAYLLPSWGASAWHVKPLTASLWVTPTLLSNVNCHSILLLLKLQKFMVLSATFMKRSRLIYAWVNKRWSSALMLIQGKANA
eukprot:1161179-Pelagomonas_calceolata.AAC.9